jgi:hypothetical protein
MSAGFMIASGRDLPRILTTSLNVQKPRNKLFWKAYGRAMDMFFPLEIQPGVNVRPEKFRLLESQRFPYLDEPGSIPSGSSGGLIIPFLVPGESLGQACRELMETNYANSVAEDEGGRKARA